ncbi:hypothetical protein AX15_001372 [Amanita polypyramis BW_CC]|nr:hypothetical protein AX15_001372 [Amanita polypyramis BW_CC]
MAPRRPSAFEVSFPDEAPPEQPIPSARPPVGPSTIKRRGESLETSGRPQKQRQLPLVSFYVSRPDEQRETKDLVVPGENPEEDPLEEDEKPIRVLTDFSIFDPCHRNEMVSLASIEEADGIDRHFEGAGWVTAYFVNPDVGQEDWEDEDEGKVYVRLGAILRYSVNYKLENDPFYIETEYGWYMLKTPSKEYESTYKMFYIPQRVSQLVISAALRRPGYSYASFIERYKNMVDIFGRTCQEEDMWDAAAELRNIIEEIPEHPQLKSVPVVEQIIRKAPPESKYRPRARAGLPNLTQARNRLPPNNRAFRGNLDSEVLKAENQNVTHVTPRIAELIQGLVREELQVVGARPPPKDKIRVEALKRKAYIELCSLIKKARVEKKNIDWRKEDRIGPGSDYVHLVTIDGKVYSAGDFILVPIAPEELPEENNVPRTGKIPDYFWFARIIYLMPQDHEVHVQWLEHGSQIFLEELAHPQELFLNDLCGHIKMQSIVGKVVVHERPENVPTGPSEYFYKFNHDKETAALFSIDVHRSRMVADHQPPENCSVCVLSEQRDQTVEPRTLREDGAQNGVAYGDYNFHLYDFVLYRAEKGPGDIGYIVEVGVDTVRVKQVGRIGSLDDILPDNVVRDEVGACGDFFVHLSHIFKRHVFLTDDKVLVPARDLVHVVYAFPIESIPDLGEWLDESPDHFFIEYAFPSMTINSWEERMRIDCDNFIVCSTCCKEKLEQRKLLRKFLADTEPMAVLDLFGGVGAFSLGMKEGFSGLKVTHTIEVSPSTAKTFMRNSPDTIVYNQCANIMLRYAIKKQQGHQMVDIPKQLYDGETPMPDPPRQGDIQMITAGFPCQSHSGLNMFKLANDPKTNLIFNAMSYMDAYRPKMGYFENVPGFLSYSLNATQASVHRLEGGIPMGGLKILVRALVDLGYQVRFGLLQAAHYGTPQSRVRFFLIAALDGTPLPPLPQPTHYFPQTNHLLIKSPKGDIIQPIKVESGVALHPPITVDDAISDLPRFDWKHPRPSSLTPQRRSELIERERTIPAFVCDGAKPCCGYSQRRPAYHHEPKTRYQVAARRRPTTDLQQYTKCVSPTKVERVVSIPLRANADYRSLEPHLLEWHLLNPTSWVARNNYRAGLYGRLDGKSYFPTTVTNVDPTAKQCRVLHPYCRRMISVRELARSQGFPDHFVFEALDKNVITMHRQIGNAVPIPVAVAMGRQLRQVLFRKWLEDRGRVQEDAMEMDEDNSE